MALIYCMLAGCSRQLRDGLDETQADDIVALLRQEGVSASKSRDDKGGWSVTLERNDEQLDAERIIHLYNLPRNRHASIPQLFPGGGLLPSELEEHVRYQYAIGQELSTAIERIDGVLSANVQVAIPQRDPKRIDPAKNTASAIVRYRGDQRVDLMKTQIRGLMAAAIPEAQVENMSLLMIPVSAPTSRSVMAAIATESERGYRAIWYVLPWVIVLLLGVALVAQRRPDLALRGRTLVKRVMAREARAARYGARSADRRGKS
ncbi:type III secretion system inner membrane ring lipoprotein SctJ [Dyella sp.]|uniref:type III secretion system inner membrane ring lipoprotein SctJ n=1 Tax=Dyella sp. TaxID=1869338 RepID=UPI002ED12FD1